MTERRSTEERKAEIVRAVISIIANDGLGRFTTAGIARAVGLSEGALFRHYPSKEAIILDVATHLERTLAASIAPPCDDPLDALRCFFTERVALLRREPDLVRILFSSQLEQALGPELNGKIIRVKQASIKKVRDCLLRARDNGLLRDDLPTDALLWFVIGMLQALVSQPGAHQAVAFLMPDEALWRVIEAFLRGK